MDLTVILMALTVLVLVEAVIRLAGLLAGTVVVAVALAGVGAWLVRGSPQARARRAKIVGALVGLVVVVVLGLVVFPGPLLRLMLPNVEDRTGVAVDFGSVTLNPLAASATVRGLTLEGGPSPDARLDLTAEKVSVDIGALRTITGTLTVEDAEVSGVSGSLKYRGKEAKPPDATASTEEVAADREAVIDSFAIRDVDIEVEFGERDPLIGQMRIDELTGRDIRSPGLVVSTLLGVQGRVEVLDVVIESTVDRSDTSVQTRWIAREIPLHLLGRAFGHGLERLNGTAEVLLRFQWDTESLRANWLEFEMTARVELPKSVQMLRGKNTETIEVALRIDAAEALAAILMASQSGHSILDGLRAAVGAKLDITTSMSHDSLDE